jgi:hypothetical protein
MEGEPMRAMSICIPRASRFAGAISAAVVVAACSARAGAPSAGQHPPIPPPAAKGIVVLFDGSKESLEKNWTKSNLKDPAAWKITDEGMVVSGGDIVTREKFSDYQLHVEFKVPDMPNATGQAKGNSGVFQQGRYEIQVLDSFGFAEPGMGDCGALYNTAAPLVNACRPAKVWQTYDITFRSPRFDDAGKQTEPGRVTVVQNGVCVQNNTLVPGPTWGNTFGKLSDPGPIVLQDHGNPMEFRNIWILPLPQKGSAQYGPK